jgi:hypothetical protein
LHRSSANLHEFLLLLLLLLVLLLLLFLRLLLFTAPGFSLHQLRLVSSSIRTASSEAKKHTYILSSQTNDRTKQKANNDTNTLNRKLFLALYKNAKTPLIQRHYCDRHLLPHSSSSPQAPAPLQQRRQRRRPRREQKNTTAAAD